MTVTVSAQGHAEPAALVLTTAPPESGVVGVRLARPIVVRLVDRFENPAAVAGVQVGASARPSLSRSVRGTLTVATDSSGVATFTDLAVLGAAGSTSLLFMAPQLVGVSGPFTLFTLVAEPPTRLSTFAGPSPRVNTVGVGYVGDVTPTQIPIAVPVGRRSLASS